MSPQMIRSLFLAALVAGFGMSAQAGDAAKGRLIAGQVCAACHGADGNSQLPAFPRLAGQQEDYIVHALNEYKAGKRKDPVMAPMAAPLSKDDIANVAAYFSAQSGLVLIKR